MKTAAGRLEVGALVLGLVIQSCALFEGKPDEKTAHRSLDVSDCSAQGSLRLCIEAAEAGDSPAYAYVEGSFELTVTGPIRLHGKDTLAANLHLPFDFLDKEFQQWEGGDSVAIAGGPAVFRACIRDASDSVLCDSVSVSSH